MKRTFFTTKNKEEIMAELNDLREHYSEYAYAMLKYQIRIAGQNEIRVAVGRGSIYWRVDASVSGKIYVISPMKHIERFLKSRGLLGDLNCGSEGK